LQLGKLKPCLNLKGFYQGKRLSVARPREDFQACKPDVLDPVPCAQMCTKPGCSCTATAGYWPVKALPPLKWEGEYGAKNLERLIIRSAEWQQQWYPTGEPALGGSSGNHIA